MMHFIMLMFKLHQAMHVKERRPVGPAVNRSNNRWSCRPSSFSRI